MTGSCSSWPAIESGGRNEADNRDGVGVCSVDCRLGAWVNCCGGVVTESNGKISSRDYFEKQIEWADRHFAEKLAGLDRVFDLRIASLDRAVDKSERLVNKHFDDLKASKLVTEDVLDKKLLGIEEDIKGLRTAKAYSDGRVAALSIFISSAVAMGTTLLVAWALSFFN